MNAPDERRSHDTTGAVLTGIIMLSEMTGDYSTMLPLVITCSVAYAVRKGIMEESIYTMKLRARRHPVPEGCTRPC